jgi:tetratricopeptide (TPR) repeat protein
MNLGLRYFERKEYTEAIDAFRKTMELSPDYPMAHFFISITYFETGKFEESFAHVSKAEILMKMETPESSAKKNSELRQALKFRGKPGYWRKVLEFEIDLYKKGRGSSVYIAGAYSVLGEKEKAFEWLEKAYIERDNQITYLRTDYTFDNIRSDPRFQNLLQRIGLSE